MADRPPPPPPSGGGRVEQVFKAAFFLSFTPVFVVDDERRLREASEAGCELLGLSREEALARTIDDILPLQARLRFGDLWRGFLSTGAWEGEITICRGDGSPRNVVFSAKANVLPDLHLVALRHVTERRPAEDDLERLFADSPDLLAVAGLDGYLKHINRAWERTLGYSEQELLARPLMDVVHPDDVAPTLAMMARLAEGEPGNAFRNRCRCRDSTYRTIEWNVVPFRGQPLVTAIGRVEPLLAEDSATQASWARADPERLPQAQEQERLADEIYDGMEQTVLSAFEQQLRILERITRHSPEPLVAAVRGAQALRRALGQMGTIVNDLSPPPDLLRQAVDELPSHSGVDRSISTSVAARLTQREHEVFRLVGQGHANRTIAAELFLAEVTVKKHVQSILSKLEVHDRTQAAIIGIKLGLDR